MTLGWVRRAILWLMPDTPVCPQPASPVGPGRRAEVRVRGGVLGPLPRGASRSLWVFASRGPGHRGAAAAPEGGADLQGVPGPLRVHRLCALWPPGVCRVCAQPAAVPHLQGPHPQLCAHLPVLGQGGCLPAPGQVRAGSQSHQQAGPAWPVPGTSPRPRRRQKRPGSAPRHVDTAVPTLG